MQSPDGRPVFRIVTSAGEAEEHLRVIRQAMERSTRHSTLSGLSGVLAGLIALAACFLTQYLVGDPGEPKNRFGFVAVWGATLGLAALGDILLTKRRATRVGKTAFSALGMKWARTVLPGLLAGAAITLFYLTHPGLMGPFLYGFWMLCYAVSLLAIGILSVREVSLMGWAFLLAGTVTLLLPADAPIGPRGMMAVTFGGFHMVYGLWMGFKYGW